MTREEKKGLESNQGLIQAPTFASWVTLGKSVHLSELAFLTYKEKIVTSILLTFWDRSEGSETHRLQLGGSERSPSLSWTQKDAGGHSGQEKALPMREQRWPRLEGRKEHSISGE